MQLSILDGVRRAAVPILAAALVLVPLRSAMAISPCISLVPAVGDEDPKVGGGDDMTVYIPELSGNTVTLPLPTFLGRWAGTRSRELAIASAGSSCVFLAVGAGKRLETVQENGPCVGEFQLGFMVDAWPDRLGRHIAFTADYPPRPGLNVNQGDSQVFVWQFPDTILQITQPAGPGVVGVKPALDGEGTRVAYSSNGNPTGGNPDGSFEVFVRDLPAGPITQVTTGVGCDSGTIGASGAEGPSISEDGQRIAFVSNCNLNGGNPFGLQTAFVADLGLGALVQLPHCAGCGIADLPAISKNGLRVLNYDISGFGATSVVKLMVHTIGAGSATTTELCTPISQGQLSLGEAFLAFGGFNQPAVSETGNRIAFAARANPTGANPMGFFEVFVADLAPDLQTAKTRQVTKGDDASASLGVSLDWKGSRLWTWGTFEGVPAFGQKVLRVTLREP
jgi:WD40-like Beta Propeller Repeat